MTTKQEKLDELGALAQMLLLRDGEIVPVLYMQSSTGVGMIGLINFGPSHEDRMRQDIIIVVGFKDTVNNRVPFIKVQKEYGNLFHVTVHLV